MATKTNKKKKKEPWIKKRHAIITAIAGAVLRPYIKCKYNIKKKKLENCTCLLKLSK